jgi:hypothetical protein
LPILFPGIIDFDPIPIGIHKPNLFYSIDAGGHGIFFTGPVFERDIVLSKPGGKLIDGRYSEAEMVIFWMLLWSGGALDEVEMGFWTDAEPGMFAVVEGFGYGVEPDDVQIEIGAGLQVYDVEGDMVDAGFGACLCHKGLTKESQSYGKA